MAMTEAPTEQGWIPSDSFAARLVTARQAKGLTQREAAEQCGLDDGSWSNWENGSKPRGMDEVVRKITDGLGVDRDWLMWGYVCPRCGETRSRCSCGNPLVNVGQLDIFVDTFREVSAEVDQVSGP